MTVPAKEAVDSAIAYVSDFFRDDNVGDVLLEELELSSDEKEWLVTVSFLRPPPSLIAPLAGDLVKALQMGTRVYKVVHIDANTKAMRALKIREFGGSAERP